MGRDASLAHVWVTNQDKDELANAARHIEDVRSFFITEFTTTALTLQASE